MVGGVGRTFASVVVYAVVAAFAAAPAEAAFEGSRLPLPPRPAVVRATVASVHVPVLMYHHISEVPRDATEMRRDLTVTPAAFRAQLALLRANGYTTVTADDVWSALYDGATLPPRPVVLTFDDGYADAFDVALPLLHEYGAVGVFFVVVDLLGQDGYLTRHQVRALSDAGMDIESHGMDHINMAKLTADRQRAQFCGSRAILSLIAGRPVRHFAYPNGDAPASQAELDECGYRSAYLKAGGSLQESATPFLMRRIRVPGGSAAAALAYLLSR